MIKGLKQLESSLKGLGKQLGDVNMQKIHAKAAEPLVHKMHRLAPVGLTGNLAESIGVVKTGKDNKLQGIIEVGPRRKGGFKGFTGHLNEFGTKERRVKKRHPIFGFDRGKMPAKPFVRPSWESEKDEVVSRVEKIYSGDISKYLKRTVPK